MSEDEPIIGGTSPAGVPGGDKASALLGRLKEALAQTVPGLDAALIEGDDLAGVERSFEALKAFAASRPVAVPAGAPPRTVAVPSTPFEKIRAGLARL
jgi:hypothetical protein